MKKIDLFKKLESIKNKEKILYDKKCQLVDQKNKEIETSTKAIEEMYKLNLDSLEEELNKKNSEIKDICKILHNYSNFPIWDMLYTISGLLSYVEGEKYIPYIKSLLDPTVIIKESIINDEKFNSADIYKLYDSGDLIIFNNHSYHRLALYDIHNNPSYMFGKFNYLNEFIHSLIQYRIDNDKKEDMSFENELYNFIIDYLLQHPDLEEKNAKKRKEMLKEEFWANTKKRVLNKKN